MEKNHRKLFEFIIELGVRLKAASETIANASIYCYKVLKNDFPKEICVYTLASSCFLLAGKITNDSRVTVRDVMNISYSVLHPKKPPLEIGELSYEIRESLVEMELVVLRYLRFRLNFNHPHKHLTLMLAILRDWYPNMFASNPAIEQVAGMLLQDLYVAPRLIIEHRPATLAVVVASMTFAALRLEIADEAWIPVLQPAASLQRISKLRALAVKEVYS